MNSDIFFLSGQRLAGTPSSNRGTWPPMRCTRTCEEPSDADNVDLERWRMCTAAEEVLCVLHLCSFLKSFGFDICLTTCDPFLNVNILSHHFLYIYTVMTFHFRCSIPSHLIKSWFKVLMQAWGACTYLDINASIENKRSLSYFLESKILEFPSLWWKNTSVNGTELSEKQFV